jgi:hypothetical protein
VVEREERAVTFPKLVSTEMIISARDDVVAGTKNFDSFRKLESERERERE